MTTTGTPKRRGRPPRETTPAETRVCKLHGSTRHTGRRHYQRKDGTWLLKWVCTVCDNERLKAHQDRARRAAKVPTRLARRADPAPVVPGAVAPPSQRMPEVQE